MVTTVTPITALANVAMTYAFGILATLVLVAMLVAKEIAGSSADSFRSSRDLPFGASLDRVLNVDIIPLLVVFATVAVDRITTFLR